MPPKGVTVAEPSAAPKQSGAALAEMSAVTGMAGCSIVMEVFDVQLFASVTVTV